MSSTVDEQQRELAKTGLQITKLIYFTIGLTLGSMISFLVGYMYGVGLF